MAAKGQEQLLPRDPGSASTLGNINFETRYSGKTTPAFDNFEITGSADVLHYFIDAIETIAPLGTTTGGQPRQYAGANFTMFRLDNMTRTADTTFADVVQGMVICDNGSGAKVLLVGFGSSSSIKNATRSLTTDTAPWTTTNAGTGAQFWGICKAGADIYAVTDAGVAVLGEYRVSKCPQGNDPTLAASWGNGLEVGTPEWAIGGLAAIGDSIVAGKPDGLYYYNDQTKRFENVMAFLEKAPHALNGKGMKAIQNGVLYPTHDGKLFFFDGVAVQEVTPLKGLPVPRDTLTSRITAVADNGDTVAVAMECWQNTTQALGLKVVTRIAGTYTDVTTSVSDGNFTTGANMGTFGNAADDALYVGANVPLEAVNVWVTRLVNAAVQSFATPQYSNGTTGSAAPFDSSFTSFTAGSDASILSVAATSLVNTGYPAAASNARLTWTDINSFDVSTLTSIQFGGAVGTLSRYWYRWKRVSATGMTANTTIDELEIVPCRPGLPNKGILTTTTNFTRRNAAGGLTHIFLAKRERSVGFIWSDVYAVHTLGGVWAMAWTSGRVVSGATGGQNLGQGLALWGRFRQFLIGEGATRDPSRTIAPVLAAFKTSDPGPVLNLTPGGTYLSDPTRNKSLDRVVIETRFVQPADTMHIYGQWDETDIVYLGAMRGGPGFVDCTAMGLGEGRYLQLWLAFDQTVAGGQPWEAPEIRNAWVEYDLVGEPFAWAQDQADSQPPRT